MVGAPSGITKDCAFEITDPDAPAEPAGIDALEAGVICAYGVTAV